MRFFERSHVYPNDWETVTSAFWVKYPNDLQPHVQHVHTLNRDVDVENQRIKVRRMMWLEYSLPGWIERIIQRRLKGVATEEAICDLKEKRLTMKGHNETFSEFFKVEETCCYVPHPENPEWTLFTQRQMYHVTGFGHLCGVLEQAATARAKDTASKGVAAITRIVQRLDENEWKDRYFEWREQLKEITTTARERVGDSVREATETVDVLRSGLDDVKDEVISMFSPCCEPPEYY